MTAKHEQLFSEEGSDHRVDKYSLIQWLVYIAGECVNMAPAGKRRTLDSEAESVASSSQEYNSAYTSTPVLLILGCVSAILFFLVIFTFYQASIRCLLIAICISCLRPKHSSSNKPSRRIRFDASLSYSISIIQHFCFFVDPACCFQFTRTCYIFSD